MAEGAFRALLGVDLRRLRGHVARGAGLTVAALALFALLGRADRETVASVLLGTSGYYLLWPPLSAMIDRLEGGLELVSGLPVQPATVARARLAGISLALLPVGLQGAGAFALLVKPVLDLDPSVVSVTGAFLVSWAAAVGIGGLGAGVILRWGVDAAGRWPVLAGGLALMGIVLLGERYGGVLADSLSLLLQRAGMPLTLAGVCAVTTAVCAGLAYRLIRNGIEAYQPEGGRLRG